MFTQFRYSQDLGFGILLTEPTEFVDKPFFFDHDGLSDTRQLAVADSMSSVFTR